MKTILLSLCLMLSFPLMATETLTCQSPEQPTPVFLGLLGNGGEPYWLTYLCPGSPDKLDENGDWFKIYKAIHEKTMMNNVLIFAGYDQQPMAKMRFVSQDRDEGGCKFGLMSYCPCDGFWWVKKHGKNWIVTK
jgi:hypothetical protein